jgi:transcriptional regulator with XRE-family HTH domain
MPKPINRAYSRYSRDAAQLLGQMIRLGRMNRKMTLAELAERAGVSRGLIQRIERGDMGCAIGAVFEVATIVGIGLFDADQSTLTASIASNRQTLTLLPKSTRTSRKAIKDDF